MAAGWEVASVATVSPAPSAGLALRKKNTDTRHHLALVSCSCLPPIIIGAVNRVASVGS